MSSYIPTPKATVTYGSLPKTEHRAATPPPRISSGAQLNIYSPDHAPVNVPQAPVNPWQLGHAQRAFQKDKASKAVEPSSTASPSGSASSPSGSFSASPGTAVATTAHPGFHVYPHTTSPGIGAGSPRGIGPASAPAGPGGLNSGSVKGLPSGEVRPRGELLPLINPTQNAKALSAHGQTGLAGRPTTGGSGPIVAGPGARPMGEYGPPTSGALPQTAGTGDFNARLGTSATFTPMDKSKAIETTGREAPTGGGLTPGVYKTTFSNGRDSIKKVKPLPKV